jgi:formamidopyrimidine-DNA glycosylase
VPELPEVETTVRGLAAVLEGRRLTRVEPRRPDLRRPMPPDLGQRLTGARVIGLGRRAKYGLIGTDRGDTLIFHLGMSGHWRIDPQEVGAHDHLLMETEEGRRLSLNDPRRFGSLDLVPSDGLGEWPHFKALGPEPFELDGRWFRTVFNGRTAPVKALLLDQRIVAGLGNIYACEALYRAGIHPRRPAGSLSLGSTGSPRPFRACLPRRLPPADRACAISSARTARLDIFHRASRSTAGKERNARAARRSAGSSRAAVRPSTARAASADNRLSR